MGRGRAAGPPGAARLRAPGGHHSAEAEAGTQSEVRCRLPRWWRWACVGGGWVEGCPAPWLAACWRAMGWVADGWRGAPPHCSLHAGEQWAAAPLHHGGEENKHAGRSRMATKCSPLPLRASIEYRHRNLARGVSTTARGQWAVRLRVPRTGSCVTIGAFAWEREAAAVADLAFLWRDIQGNGGERVCAM